MSRKKHRDRSDRRVRRQQAHVGHRLRAFDLHVPVFAYIRKPDGSIETPSAVIYGTAFPIASGIFATAAHVIEAAAADGTPGLSYVSAAADKMVHYPIQSHQLYLAIDLALIECPSLKRLPPTPIDFDRKLEFLSNASALGFPLALDAEFVTCIPRAFGGHVVTRRELYHLPARPPGYEVSFASPQGLSGAPLISTHFGRAFCYGDMIQQSTLGVGDHKTSVGIAVDIGELLSVKSSYAPEGLLARLFGREPVPERAPSPRRLPGGAGGFRIEDLDKGWPDDDLPPSMGEEVEE